MKTICIQKKDGIPVVLGGGGSRGPALLGLADVLHEERVICESFTGVSIGSLVGTALTNGLTTSEVDAMFADGLNIGGLGSLLRAFVPPIFDPFRLIMGGFIDLVPFMRDLVAHYGFTTEDALRIVAYDVHTRQPIVFEGHDYDLALALAASCAVPGMMRPVRCTYKGRNLLLVDGGVWHPQPGSLSEKPAIIGKLIDPIGLGFVYPDRPEDFVVSVGKPFSRFFTSLSREKVAELHQYGYSRAREALAVPLRRGLFPVAA